MDTGQSTVMPKSQLRKLIFTVVHKISFSQIQHCLLAMQLQGVYRL